jgi:hypothetical protein
MSIRPALRLHCYLPTMSRIPENLLRFRPKPPARPLFSPNQFCQVGSPRITSSLFPPFFDLKLEKGISQVLGRADYSHIMVGPNVASPPTRQETVTPDWAMAEVQEFVPQQFEASSHSHMVGSTIAGLFFLGYLHCLSSLYTSSSDQRQW